jgi:hypothetical protein
MTRDILQGAARDKYEVIVGNIGTVYAGDSLTQALKIYTNYVINSALLIGRAGGESVTLMADDDILAEHVGTVEYLGE